MSQFTIYVNDSQFKYLNDKHLISIPWIPHILLCYLQKYSQVCTPVVTKSKIIRTLINGESIHLQSFKDVEFLFPKFMDLLRNYILGDNMGLLPTQPPSFTMFFSAQKREDTEPIPGRPAPPSQRTPATRNRSSTPALST